MELRASPAIRRAIRRHRLTAGRPSRSPLRRCAPAVRRRPRRARCASRLRARSSPVMPCAITLPSISDTPCAPLSTIIWSTEANALAAASTICGHCSASCWPMTASWFCASASARALIAAASARPLALMASPSARPRTRVAVASASPSTRVLVASACACSSICRARASAAAMSALRCAVAIVSFSYALASAGRRTRREQLLLGLLRFQLGDLRLLDHDLLAGGGVGDRAGLFGLGGGAVDFGLVAGDLDLAVALRGRLERGRFRFARRRLPGRPGPARCARRAAPPRRTAGPGSRCSRSGRRSLGSAASRRSGRASPSRCPTRRGWLRSGGRARGSAPRS